VSPETQRAALGLHPLPAMVDSFLKGLNAPPRLLAHLILVHDTAVRLVESFRAAWPTVPLDVEAVLIGAAWHDIGKLHFPEELTESGHLHEARGMAFLQQSGIEQRLARFAVTHHAWATEPSAALEDFLVALADTVWKGKRDRDLEQRIIDTLAAISADPPWSIFLTLDTIIEALTANADKRLAWQAQFPVSPHS